MIETFHGSTPAVIPPIPCDHCGKPNRTQMYTITLDRPNVTREWNFDTLECLRAWAAPVK